MRTFVLSLGTVLLIASSARAQSYQSNQSNPAIAVSGLATPALSEFALNAPSPVAPLAAAEPGDAASSNDAASPSNVASPSDVASSSAVATPSNPLPVAAASPAPAPQGDVQSVYQKYSWQLYGGYTFLRFYELPHVTQNANGFDIGTVYYYHSSFYGADGELVGTFGSALGYNSRFTFASGGPRFRWSGPRGLELWGHGLVGIADLVPRTAYGPENSFGYEVGGGIDIDAHHRRIAYRAEADLLGTHFFGTYQYSPKVSVGIVFKF